MTIKGIDTTDRSLTGATLKSHGYAFACRYVANSPAAGHTDKQLTGAEIREKSGAGVRLVSNFEWGAVPSNTVATGKAHARAFLDSPAGVMGPDWHPCYYSVDTAAHAGAFDNYAHGWADVLGPERCGVYGDGALYRALKAAGLVHYAWQSMSSSFPGNSSHAGADLIQTGSGHVAGHSCDFNTATGSLYGGWLLGEADPNKPKPTPPEGEDMDLTPQNLADIAHACAAYKNTTDPSDVDMHQHAVDASSALKMLQNSGGAAAGETVTLSPATIAAIVKAVNDDAAARLQN